MMSTLYLIYMSRDQAQESAGTGVSRHRSQQAQESAGTRVRRYMRRREHESKGKEREREREGGSAARNHGRVTPPPLIINIKKNIKLF
jgi:hypothetical protein